MPCWSMNQKKYHRVKIHGNTCMYWFTYALGLAVPCTLMKFSSILHHPKLSAYSWGLPDLKSLGNLGFYRATSCNVRTMVHRPAQNQTCVEGWSDEQCWMTNDREWWWVIMNDDGWSWMIINNSIIMNDHELSCMIKHIFNNEYACMIIHARLHSKSRNNCLCFFCERRILRI